ncbi:MAG: Uma2 family endonuclease [Defluviitaleaceae bacterium]|nr:Uma2 family endonuclease [Defluviitaleaceae bacterium]
MPGQAAQTYEDLRDIDGDERYEIIGGKVIAMSPAPRTNHQRLQNYAYREFAKYFDGKACEAFTAPLDVFFLAGDESGLDDCKNIVQPDLFVVCDKKKIIPEGCKGAPNFVMEILSRSTRKTDLSRKLPLYQDFGVKEYWVVDPDKRLLMVYQWEDGAYNMPDSYPFSAKVESRIFEGLSLDFSKVELL